MALAASSQQVETDEPRHVVGTRAACNLLRQALLYHPAVLNDHQPIGEDSRIDRVVRHQKCRAREIAQVAPHLGAYQQACFGVKRGQRLIQQEQPGLGRERAGQRHPLSLTSRHGPRLGVRQVGNAHPGEPVAAARRRASDLSRSLYQRPECDIVKHGEVREQQIVLEDHPDGPLVRRSMDTGRCIGHYPASDRDLPGREPKQSSQCPQRGGLAGAVRAE